MSRYRYYLHDKAHVGLFREDRDGTLEHLHSDKGRWAPAPPAALDAITGRGEDPWSCGEWASELTRAEAEEIARGLGLPLGDDDDDAPGTA